MAVVPAHPVVDRQAVRRLGAARVMDPGALLVDDELVNVGFRVDEDRDRPVPGPVVDHLESAGRWISRPVDKVAAHPDRGRRGVVVLEEDVVARYAVQAASDVVVVAFVTGIARIALVAVALRVS